MRVKVKSEPLAKAGADTGGGATVGGGCHEQVKFAKTPAGSAATCVTVCVFVVVVVVPFTTISSTETSVWILVYVFVML
jgi:hypothetical protein